MKGMNCTFEQCYGTLMNTQIS